jgi:hypothetical protein
MPGCAVLAACSCARRRTPCDGDCTFAERHDCPAPVARLLWHVDVDPLVLAVRAESGICSACDTFDLERLGCWATLALDADGSEHLVLSDGARRIRIDVLEGSLHRHGPVKLHYLVSGITGVEPRLRTIERLLAVWRTGSFPVRLFPEPGGVARRIDALRVHDARAAGASYRDIATILFGAQAVRTEWRGRSDYLHARVRRLAIEARHMIRGGWRDLLRGGAVQASHAWRDDSSSCADRPGGE